MGKCIPVLIIGHSGSGKSASLRNLTKEEYSLVNPLAKRLPFKGGQVGLESCDYELIKKFIQETPKNIIVIDDSNYLLTMEMKRAKTLVSAAEHSVGSKEAPEAARIELKNLLNDMEVYASRLEELLQDIEEKLKEIPYVDKLMSIKGIGLVTVSGFIAEVGDIGRFDNPKQLQKLAGYAIVANDSGKHNGESRISYRGRKRLRYVLYEAAISLIGKNAEFREIHEYYRTRKENPLKKMQSVVAVACKILRIFYTILTKGVDYDAEKLMSDIRRPKIQAA